VDVGTPLRRAQEEKVTEIFSRLRALTDDQLKELQARFAHIEELANAGTPAAFSEAWENPVARAHFALYDLILEEMENRHDTLRAVEADFAGGHLVEVGYGDEPGTFCAYCVPDYRDEEGCWYGPDRATVEEALEDGRQHHPGHEPRVHVAERS
jgi:hypothetical protein